MKKLMRRAIALLLMLCLLPSPLARAEDGEYDYPDDWSRPALIFAVENNIFQGDHHHDLRPHSYISRAEMAAVLVRMLGVTERADLSAYTDVAPTDWFYDEMSAAVAAGIFTGVSGTSMEPDNALTREQTMVVIARAFGIASNDRTSYLYFVDSSLVSPYARDAVSALARLGLMSGYNDRTIRPGRPITRAEVAQIIYNLFSVIADTPEELPTSGSVLYRGAAPLPAELTVAGNLVIGPTACREINAENWNISGFLSIRTGTNTQAELAGLTADALTFAPVSGKASGSVKDVFLQGETEYTGATETLTLLGGSHTVAGDTTTLTQREGAYLILEGSVTGSALLEDQSAVVLKGSCPVLEARNQVSVVLHGDAQSLTLGDGSTLITYGNVGSLSLADNCTATLPCDMDTLDITGDHVTLTVNGTIGTINISGNHVTIDGTGYVELVTVTGVNANVTVSFGQYDDLVEIKTALIPCTARYDVSLYRYNGGSGYICTIPAGTVVYNADGAINGWIYVILPDGTCGWTPGYSFRIDAENVIFDGEFDYSTSAKEHFVNNNGYQSKTPYLLWISRYTQKVCLFEGSAGNWKLTATWPCASGTAYTPTPGGIYDIYEKTTHWDFGAYIVYDVSLFYGGCAFHTYLLNHNGTIYDDTLGRPMSHGCIRMNPTDCAYIYDNIPKHTTVVVY